MGQTGRKTKEWQIDYCSTCLYWASKYIRAAKKRTPHLIQGPSFFISFEGLCSFFHLVQQDLSNQNTIIDGLTLLTVGSFTLPPCDFYLEIEYFYSLWAKPLFIGIHEYFILWGVWLIY
jgi:hypothetical protein